MSAATEYRVEKDSGWLFDRATNDLTPWEGIRIRWRFVGERLWRKKSIIADPEQGQTPASLKAQAPEIVAALARAAVAAVPGREARPRTEDEA